MKAKVVFRAAVPSDAAELKRLNDDFNGPGKKTAACMAKDLAASGGERVFVAQSGMVLVGFCCCQVKRSFCYETLSVEVTELYVEPEFRGHGVGKGLLSAAEESFRGMSVEKWELLTGGDNRRARGFYEHMGFFLSGEIHYEKYNG